MRKKSTDGFSVLLNTSEWIIFYDDSVNYLRVNNTIMHEIGHIVLDHTEDSDLAEKEVNFFAKYALAPPVLIQKLGLDDAADISDIFKISYEAACYALNYYRKWLYYGGQCYKDYELHLLHQFDAVG
jgi:Zn-dependent peptidase ImmA (M78 family)